LSQARRFYAGPFFFFCFSGGEFLAGGSEGLAVAMRVSPASPASSASFAVRAAGPEAEDERRSFRLRSNVSSDRFMNRFILAIPARVGLNAAAT